MKQFNGCKNYTLIREEELVEINAKGYVLEHDKTGARIILIQNDDDNKAFVIGFKTPQDNSTGVPHILEHSVLCGSDKYPVKDAMTEVSKGSLNTFLNAFTYADRTLYPVASYNDKDFQNLMSVYLDAVFYPRVYKEPKIFKQEGWHYELESPEGELKYNGVVYNEMKGVYSSPSSLLSSYTVFSLFPDTQYGVESGGDPDHIPELSYEEFLSFHKKLYTPSNSRIFLYGDMDFEEKLEFIDREYLSHFERVETDSEIRMQEPFKAPVYVEKEYPVADSESTDNKTFLAYNVVFADYSDPFTIEAVSALDYALCTAPGSILERRLLDEGIGTNIYADQMLDGAQKVFSIVAEDANPEDRDRFVEIVEDTMKYIIENGFNKKSLKASITTSEFSYREADFGSFPKGIAYAMLSFDEWNYPDEQYFSNLKLNNVYARLKDGIDDGLFEKILKEKILDNPHKSILVLKPRHGLQKEKDDALKAKLAAFKDSLTKEQIEKIIADTIELKEYQESEDSEEALRTIPTLSLSDINKESKKTEYLLGNIDGVEEFFCNLSTNGIVYFNLSFSMNRIPYRLYPAVAFLKDFLEMVDTDNYSYSDLNDEINIFSGGISFINSVNKSVVDRQFSISLDVKGKALYGNLGKTFDLIKEIIFASKLTDRKRIRELVEMGITKSEGYMIESGHIVAISRAMTYFSVAAKLTDSLSGLEKYKYSKKLSAEFDEAFDSFIADINEVISLIFNRDNLTFAFAAEESAKETIEEELKKFTACLSNASSDEDLRYPEPEVLNEGLSVASQVQYVVAAGDFASMGLRSSSRLGILRNILSNDYLWTAVRLQGGAYGAFAGFSKTGEGYMASYRDPNLKETLKAYRAASDYIRNYPDDMETIERYIITTIGDIDMPMSESARFSRAYTRYRMGITHESMQQERDEILATKVEDVRALHKYIDAICDNGVICAVGGEEMLGKEGDIFNKVVPLFE